MTLSQKDIARRSRRCSSSSFASTLLAVRSRPILPAGAGGCATAMSCIPVAGIGPRRYYVFGMIDYTKRLLQLGRALTAVERQNRLMATPDRELALSMMYMNDDDRKEFLSVVSSAKRRRIEEELRLESRLVIRNEHFRRAIETVIGRLGHAAQEEGGQGPDSPSGQPPPLRSYLRPRHARSQESNR